MQKPMLLCMADCLSEIQRNVVKMSGVYTQREQGASSEAAVHGNAATGSAYVPAGR